MYEVAYMKLYADVVTPILVELCAPQIINTKNITTA